MLAVAERLLGERARVDGLHRGEEGLEPLLGRALVRAEDALVLAGEGVPEAVLEQAARAHDDRGLPVRLQHRHHLPDHELREGALHDGRARPRGAVEERRAPPLLVPRAPEAVAHQVRVEDVGADEPGVVGLEPAAPARVGPLQDRPGEQHPGRLAAHQPGADHVPADREQVLQVEVVAGQLGEPLLARQHHPEERAQRLALLLPRAPRGADPLGHLARLQEAPVPDVEPRERVEAPLGRVGERLATAALSVSGRSASRPPTGAAGTCWASGAPAP